MDQEFYQWRNQPTSVTTGPAMDVSRYSRTTITIQGTFVATMKLQGTLDGTVWFDLGHSTDSPVLWDLETVLKQVRLNVTAYTSGTIEARVAGRTG